VPTIKTSEPVLLLSRRAELSVTQKTAGPAPPSLLPRSIARPRRSPAYRVLAGNAGDRDETLVGTTPSYLEALEWAEQARIDGWQRVRVDAAVAGAGAA
jgi:hypothetical protein